MRHQAPGDADAGRENRMLEDGGNKPHQGEKDADGGGKGKNTIPDCQKNGKEKEKERKT